jgi:hypothetical protein
MYSNSVFAPYDFPCTVAQLAISLASLKGGDPAQEIGPALDLIWKARQEVRSRIAQSSAGHQPFIGTPHPVQKKKEIA